MASPRFDIISIGTLGRNMLWHEQHDVRTAHATTTLIRVKDRRILVDPGLPPAVLGARLGERAGVRPEQIDTVFLTNFRPANRAGLALFTRAKVCIHEVEQQSARQGLERMLAQAPEEDVDHALMQQELDLLDSFQPAPDSLAPNIDLFPLFGYTAGTCGLLIGLPTLTALIAGDGVPTQDHFLAGQVLPDAFDIKAAQESMQEVYEIADVIVPGHDNLFLNPRAMGM